MLRLVLAVLMLFCSSVFAQSLTPQQLQTLRQYIDSQPDLASYPNDGDGAFAIAALLNQPSSPTFIVFRRSITITEVGLAMRSVDVAGLTTANTNRLMVIAAYSGGIFYPWNQDTWDGFNDIFSVSSAATTRANLFALRKRQGTRYEKIFATGTGSDASPATLVIEGPVNVNTILTARAN